MRKRAISQANNNAADQTAQRSLISCIAVSYMDIATSLYVTSTFLDYLIVCVVQQVDLGITRLQSTKACFSRPAGIIQTTTQSQCNRLCLALTQYAPRDIKLEIKLRAKQ